MPGDAAESELLNRVTSEEKPMPPKGDPLTPEQVAKLKAWIEQGAKYEEHWAYVKPVRETVSETQEQGLAAQRHRRLGTGPTGTGRYGAVAGSGQGDAVAARQPRPDRPAADVAGTGRLPRGRIARAPMKKRWIACWRRRPTANRWPATGSTWPATPTPTAMRKTTAAAPGPTAIGSSTPSTRTCRSMSLPSSRLPAI